MKKGFTLVEILIVIGLVGVVAAMTIPTLIGNGQKQALASKLSTTVNAFTNATTSLLAKEGENNLSETSFPDNIDEFLKTAGTPTEPTYTGLQNSTPYAFITTKSWETVNGAAIYYTASASDDYIGIIHIDSNGASQPNKVGRDLFKFGLRDDGVLVPAGSTKFDSDETCSGNGVGCAYTLVSNNYKVNY